MVCFTSRERQTLPSRCERNTDWGVECGMWQRRATKPSLKVELITEIMRIILRRLWSHIPTGHSVPYPLSLPRGYFSFRFSPLKVIIKSQSLR
jgi:hypothetical protein